MVVDTVVDENLRNGRMSLREALLLQSGKLAIADLTTAEAARVHVVRTLGLRGAVHVNFDPTVFCVTCGAAIQLAPPGLGDPDAVSLPPGLGDPDSAPPGHTHPDQIGMGVIGGVEVAAPVIIDGSLLTADQTGLRLTGSGELQGMRFQNFAGRAIEVVGNPPQEVVIGSNGDGVNDAAEAVTFHSNGEDVVYLR